MGLQIARDVVIACDYNQQYKHIWKDHHCHSHTTLLHLKVADPPMQFRCLCHQNCFEVRGLTAGHFTMVWVCLPASCAFSGVGSGLWQQAVLQCSCETQPKSLGSILRRSEAGHCRHPLPAVAFRLCWTEKTVLELNSAPSLYQFNSERKDHSIGFQWQVLILNISQNEDLGS